MYTDETNAQKTGLMWATAAKQQDCKEIVQNRISTEVLCNLNRNYCSVPGAHLSLITFEFAGGQF